MSTKIRAWAAEQKGGPLEEEIEISIESSRDLPNSLECSERRSNLLCDGAGGFTESSRQFERSGSSEVTEIAVGRMVEHERGQTRSLE